MYKLFISLIIYLFICCPAFGDSFSSGYVITQNKNNSNVFVRKTEQPYSKVLQRVSNGVPMSCTADISESPSVCFVKFNGYKGLNSGCVNKKDLVFLDQDKSFYKIPLIKNDLYSAVYKKNQITIKVKIVKKKLNEKEFSWRTTRDGMTLMYHGKKFYGSDEPISGFVFTYSSIEVNNNGKKYNIPLTEQQWLFITPFYVENNFVFDSIKIYYNAKENLMYIFSTQEEAAAMYTAVFTLKNNVLVNTNVWSEAL